MEQVNESTYTEKHDKKFNLYYLVLKHFTKTLSIFDGCDWLYICVYVRFSNRVAQTRKL